MKKTLNRVLIVAAGAVLIAAAVTVKQAKAEWQHSEAYGYDIWCDMGRFCSGPISQRSWEFWNFLGFPPYFDPNWWGNYQNWAGNYQNWLNYQDWLNYWDWEHHQDWWNEQYFWNPLEVHYGVCEWIPPFSMGFGVPCACVEMHSFAILEEGTPNCGYAVPIS